MRAFSPGGYSLLLLLTCGCFRTLEFTVFDKESNRALSARIRVNKIVMDPLLHTRTETKTLNTDANGVFRVLVDFRTSQSVSVQAVGYRTACVVIGGDPQSKTISVINPCVPGLEIKEQTEFSPKTSRIVLALLKTD